MHYCVGFSQVRSQFALIALLSIECENIFIYFYLLMLYSTSAEGL